MVAGMILDSETARIRAVLVNSGRYSLEEADAKIAASELAVFLGDDAAGTPAGQAAFLTAVATAARCFGGVTVSGATEHSLVLPLPVVGGNLADAAVFLGATMDAGNESARRITIGEASADTRAWEIHPYWRGWVAGVSPRPQQSGRGDIAVAGVAAGSLAVGQAFLAEQGDPRAGRTNQCLSLWSPDALAADAENPALGDISLPRSLWLIGLGNLGQAYLWSLFMLPYANAQGVMLYLQDDDLVDRENWGTSVLVERGRYGILKTKIAEEWADRRQYRVRRIDRRFDGHTRRHAGEPGIALSGLDRMPPRRLLGGAGFEYIIDCGLGATAASYQDLRINVFDRAADPVKHFDGVEDRTEETAAALLQLPAYQELTRQRNDGGCGAAMLAGKSAAVPFVSAFTGSLAIAQAIRIASGEAPHATVTASLGDVRTLRAAPGAEQERITVETAAVASNPEGDPSRRGPHSREDAANDAPAAAEPADREGQPDTRQARVDADCDDAGNAVVPVR
jgi:hypothetical protein